MRYLLALALIALTGCAAKTRTHNTLPTHAGAEVEFRGVHDGHCQIQDVQLDAKTGNYIIVCR